MTRTDVRDLETMADADEPITMLTAYDAPTAGILDDAGVDILLVGDTAGELVLGHDDTTSVTLDEMLTFTGAVARGSEEAMVVGDMPFESYGASMADSVNAAKRFLTEADAQAVKLETAPGGDWTVAFIDRVTELGVPVMAHTGLTPQRVNEVGGRVVQGRNTEHSASAETLIQTAEALEDAGAFAIVLELVTELAAKRVANAVDVPVIGIGAGRHVDGQVLTISDVLGYGDYDLTFDKEYADVPSVVADAAAEYVREVRESDFPTADHAFD
ncbi:MAG: 3-methyl-2-oxobutanoate hydroxymethyltransferase [Halobacteriaceae archaeon]